MAVLGAIVKRGIELRKLLGNTPKKPYNFQRKVLRRLLKTAKYTEIGQKYHFDRILEHEEIMRTFQENVPIYDYNKIYNEFWNRAVEGKENITWPGKVPYFALSSGTSEAATKYIPVTEDMIKAIKKASMKLTFALTNFSLPSSTFQKGILMLGSSTEITEVNEGVYIGDMSGISAKNIPLWMTPMYKPGKKIASIKAWDEKLDMIVKNAPKWDIGMVCGIPSWVQLLLERIIKEHKLDTIHDIWPNLNIYIHGGISFEPYRQKFAELFHHPIHYAETYMASEGNFAFKAHPESKGMKLILNCGIFYEFIPFNDQNFKDGILVDNPKAVLAHEVEEGVEYAMLISTVSGAWRYLIGDTVKFVDKEKLELVITGRIKHFLSLCGEHLSVDNMHSALGMVSKNLEQAIQEFTVQGIEHKGEKAHEWFIGVKEGEGIAANTLIQLLDDALCVVNEDYETERNNVLKGMVLHTVEEKHFYAFLKTQGKEGDQVKFPKVLPKSMFPAWKAYISDHIIESTELGIRK